MQIGDFFDGRYIIERELGRGGMGTVYLARNINTDTYWAIKEINKDGASGVDLLAEPTLLKRLEHPALPRLFDILETEDKMFIISDYINGIALDKKLEAEGKIEEELAIDWAVQLCRALDYLHTLKPNPIIYRDIKPSNIILTERGTLKLIDFGIAREYKPLSDTDTVYIGTRGYAAPEQYGTGQTSAASDIYSLGATLHHLVTGKKPAELLDGFKPVGYYDRMLSAEFEQIIIKCTKENPSERYQSASELLAALTPLYEAANVHGDSSESNINKEYPPVLTGAMSVKKAVITIWDNAEFGCELAYLIAKFTNSEVLLADLDLLAPKADIILNVKKYPSKNMHTEILGHSGLDIVMSAIGKASLTKELLLQSSVSRKELKNLHILTGSYRLDNYEYYTEDSVPKLIDKCYRLFDITILLVNRSIYDAFTLAALLRSDINIAAIKGDIVLLREFNSYIAFLKEKQNLPLSATKFVFFEYDRENDISASEAVEATQGNYIGRISFSRKRSECRNKKDTYVLHIEKEMLAEYYRVLKGIGILSDLGLMHKLRGTGGHLKMIRQLAAR